MPRPAFTATRDQVLAYRLTAQRLDRRAPLSELLAVAAMGLHDPTPGTAAQSLHARLEGLTPADVARALEVDKRLLRFWSLRMAPYVVPTADAALFTLGVRPPDTESRLRFIQGAGPSLAEVGLPVDELVARVTAETMRALDGRALPKNQLVLEVADAIARTLPPTQRDAWYQDPKYVDSRCVGEMLVAFVLRIVSLDGGFCHGSGPGQPYDAHAFVRTDQWLGTPLPPVDPEAARQALLRRHLAFLGPTTPAHFAEWAGIGRGQADASWAALGEALVPMAIGKKTAWLHLDDLAAFQAAEQPQGVRLLPPYDPYLAGRDRELLVPDKAYHKELWRAVGNPGVVLVDGEIVAAWKPRKAGKKLKLHLTPLQPLAAARLPQLEAEAASLAPFRGADRVELVMGEAQDLGVDREPF